MAFHLNISPELRSWILSTTHAGHSVDDVLRLMQENGYDAQQSRRIIAAVLNMPIAAIESRTKKPKSQGHRPTHPEGRRVMKDGSAIQVTLSVDTPPLRVLDGILSHEECKALIELARPRLERALIVDSSGTHQVDARRTSEGMFFKQGELPLISQIEERIAALLGMPVDHGEGLQVLHYLPGQQYEPHQDWFDPEQPGYAAVTAKGGQRVASLVMYLNTPDTGGGTAFPEIGLTVTALRGSAVYFAYETGDSLSLHAGLPVLTGEKWIATKWLREKPFQTPSSLRQKLFKR
ncbi:MAG: 2OG-Fe(II) oxygenase [Rhodanobacter sp.]